MNRRSAIRLFLPLALMFQVHIFAADLHGKSPSGIRNDGGDEILLQGFHWNSSRNTTDSWYSVLTKMAPRIGADGFTAIWMPVPWRDLSSWSDPTTHRAGGGEGYFWEDFNKSNRYGSEPQLKLAVAALHQANVKVVYDVVPNHMNGNFPGQEINVPKGQNNWRGDCAQCDAGDPFMSGDADLNTESPQVHALFITEFKNLQANFGADGLRFDFVKGYPAERVDSWMKSVMDQGFCVGELWKAPNEYSDSDWRHQKGWQDSLKDWSDRAHCTVFDFALKERMQNGNIGDWRNGLNANPDPRWREVAVTFVDNHDTGYSPGMDGGQHHWSLPEPLRNLAYAYILTSPGTPTVYWPDMYDWQRADLIRKLIQIRRQAGIKADSPITFHTNYSGLVAKTSGTEQSLLIALGSNLSSPPQGGGDLVLNSDNGQIRIWRYSPAQTTVDVSLRCDNGITQPGDSVYAVGTGLELGDWDPAHAVRLADTSAYPQWRGSINLSAQQSFEWKCIVRSDADPAAVKIWQPGDNNHFTATQGASAVGSF